MIDRMTYRYAGLWASGAVAVVMHLSSGAVTIANEPTTPFCRGGQILRDYLRPLQGLMANQRVPSRVPSFGNRQMSVVTYPAKVTSAGAGISYQLRIAKRLRQAMPAFRLESRLVRITSKGRALRQMKRQFQKVRHAENARIETIGFRRVPIPGIYRYDLIVRRGRLPIERYRSYHRVVRWDANIRLRMNRQTIHHGERLSGRLENYTGAVLSYGPTFAVDRFDGVEWHRISLEELFGVPIAFFLEPLEFVEPGTAAGCYPSFSIPEAMDPGSYRISKPISLANIPRGAKKSRRVVAAFTVERAAE